MLITDVHAFIQHGYRDFIPHLSIDCAILGYHDGILKILLTAWPDLDGWCLPGGYISRTESIDHAAQRILEERTGLADVFLQQYHTFGQMNRVLPLEEKPEFHDNPLYRAIRGSWLDARTVSIGYYALIDFSRATPRPDEFSRECRWWDIRELPPLLFDHPLMIKTALDTIRKDLQVHPVGLQLLPEEFTVPELQRLYETLLNRTLDRRNFMKKMQQLGILIRHDRTRSIGSHRSPYLYSFDEERYREVLTDQRNMSF
ncbi:MAG: NUDIX domain-containing protein [Bacteroidales bacterium]